MDLYKRLSASARIGLYLFSIKALEFAGTDYNRMMFINSNFLTHLNFIVAHYISEIGGVFRYIEASKTRLYKNEDAKSLSQAQAVLVYVFDTVLRLLHPFMPFVTEELWQVIHIVRNMSIPKSFGFQL